MAKSIKANINPKVLIWARNSSNFDIIMVADKIKVRPEQIENWENGSDTPTIAQLRKLANVYKFPLSVFFLSIVPKNFSVMKDFRHLPDYMPAKFSPQLQLAIRKAQQRRETAIELLSALVETVPTFSKKILPNDNIIDLALDIRKFIHLELDIQEKWKNARIAFNQIRYLIENSGILVFEIDNVALEEMRGFAIAESIMPVIAINRKDSYNGRIFSLLHEFVHILLGKGGISNSSYFDNSIEETEIFCNKLAAEILIPSSYLLMNPIIKSGINKYNDTEILTLSKQFSVSEEVVLRRLLTLKKISRSFYQEKRAKYLEVYKLNSNKKTSNKDFKQNIPVQTITGLGVPYITFAMENFNAEKINLNDLSNVLGGIKIKHIKTIGEKLGGIYG